MQMWVVLSKEKRPDYTYEKKRTPSPRHKGGWEGGVWLGTKEVCLSGWLSWDDMIAQTYQLDVYGKDMCGIL